MLDKKLNGLTVIAVKKVKGERDQRAFDPLMCYPNLFVDLIRIPRGG